jgi:pimeloyl-ACP methyl ester carboxylesterase
MRTIDQVRAVGRLVAVVLTFVACAEPKPAVVDTTNAASARPAVLTALASAPDRSFMRGDVPINYRTIGSGEPVLLIHGYGDNLMMWSGFLADSLARDHRVIAMDTRAFGKSGKPAGGTHYGTAMVDDIAALLDQEHVTQAHIVGYSMGALLAARLATTHPERVRTVALLAGPVFKDSAAARTLLTPWLADARTGKRLQRFVRWVVPTLPDSMVRMYSDQMYTDGDSAALEGVLDAFPSLTLDWSAVAQSAVPAVVAVGIDDPLRRYSKALAAAWPKARHIELPGTDHTNVFSRPEVLGAVRALLDAHPIR